MLAKASAHPTLLVTDTPLSRASPLPQGDWGESVRNWSAVRPPSLASQLPQWDWVSQLETGRLSGRHREQAHSYRKAKQSRQTACSSPLNGRVSARRKLLILPCRPHRQAEWRGLSGGRRAAPCGEAAYIERRCSEANRRRFPRMNPATKEPEPRRGPYAGAKTFGYFGAFAKVTRRKGETASSSTRSNGYVPHQPKAWSAQRPPGQAKPH